MGSGDVGYRMVGERWARPLRRRRRTTRAGRLPKAQPGEYVLDHGRVFDQRDHAHLRAAFRAEERIDLIDLANELK